MSAFDWQSVISVTKRARQIKPPVFFAGLQAPKYHPGTIYVVNSEQYQADCDRRDSIKRALPAGRAA